MRSNDAGKALLPLVQPFIRMHDWTLWQTGCFLDTLGRASREIYAETVLALPDVS